MVERYEPELALGSAGAGCLRGAARRRGRGGAGAERTVGAPQRRGRLAQLYRLDEHFRKLVTQQCEERPPTVLPLLSSHLPQRYRILGAKR